MLEYIAVEPRKSVNSTTCEPTTTCSVGEITSAANKSRNSCQLVTLAAVKISSSPAPDSSATWTGNGFGLRTENADPELLNSNFSGWQIISTAADGKSEERRVGQEARS